MAAYLTDTAIWPMVNLLQFRYIPLHFRPAFMGFAQVLWQTYLSHISFLALEVVEEEEEVEVHDEVEGEGMAKRK